MPICTSSIIVGLGLYEMLAGSVFKLNDKSLNELRIIKPRGACGLVLGFIHKNCSCSVIYLLEV
jgi:hypothetical protein